MSFDLGMEVLCMVAPNDYTPIKLIADDLHQPPKKCIDAAFQAAARCGVGINTGNGKTVGIESGTYIAFDSPRDARQFAPMGMSYMKYNHNELVSA